MAGSHAGANPEMSLNLVSRQRIKETLRLLVPLAVRKRLSILLSRQRWLGPDLQYWWTKELLADFARSDSGAYHRFLWSQHLAYAKSYEADRRFGEENMKESRKLFFDDLGRILSAEGANSPDEVRSVLEVGCSLGYQLRHLEMGLFSRASDLLGIDIDRHAIAEGSEYLSLCGSRVRLVCSDMGNLGSQLGDRAFDVVISTGVLMYLDEQEAGEVVREMLRHTTRLLALSGPAFPDRDNRTIERSVLRERDGSWIHNLDALVEKAGGTVVSRRWEGKRVVDGHTIYFVFAERPDAHALGEQ